jgi:hypothetical protein
VDVGSLLELGAFTVLGSVFLALTGGEALYADMGHFGRPAIRVDWYAVVMPALMLNYLGQGALVLSEPAAASNPFFLLFSPVGTDPGRRRDDSGDYHSEPSCNLGGVRARAAGHSTGRPSSPGRAANLR